MREILKTASKLAARYLEELPERGVAATPASIGALSNLAGDLPETGSPPEAVLKLLDEYGSPGTVASAGPRYFGFVTGGALPASLGANWLAGAWDQNAFSSISSPTGAAIEAAVAPWLIELLRLPTGCAAAFVTGATMANFTALAAARHRVLTDVGWDVNDRGLIGAPAVQVIVGAQAHATLFKALGLLGLGRGNVHRVAVDREGRVVATEVPAVSGPTIVCLQAGNVNSGSFDPIGSVCDQLQGSGAWVHVDGAFGLWAAASPPMPIWFPALSWPIPGPWMRTNG